MNFCVDAKYTNCSVKILMSTFNGEKYLEEQIQSILNQSWKGKIDILVRDDGSSDNTCQILKSYEEKNVLKWYKGANLKSARSFMELIYNTSSADFYAFCDQDDIWLPDKIETAIKKIYKIPIPALYFCKTQPVKEDLTYLPFSKFNPICTLGEFLIVNFASGCTFVFNHALLETVKLKYLQEVPMHDSWIYRVCLAMEGKVVYDPVPHILYRQHSENVIGHKKDFVSVFKRKILLLKGEKHRSALIKLLYNTYKDVLPLASERLLYNVVGYEKSFIKTLQLLFNSNYRTNSLYLNLKFCLAVLFRLY